MWAALNGVNLQSCDQLKLSKIAHDHLQLSATIYGHAQKSTATNRFERLNRETLAQGVSDRELCSRSVPPHLSRTGVGKF